MIQLIQNGNSLVKQQIFNMQIQYEKEIIEMNDEWSFKNFINKYCFDIPDNISIYSSCFLQEKPFSEVFRKDLKVKFYNCNLDNCIIPEGCEIFGKQPINFQLQNDGNDWIINEERKPVKPIDFEIFEKLNLDIPNPDDIPVEKEDYNINLLEVAKSKDI